MPNRHLNTVRTADVKLGYLCAKITTKRWFGLQKSIGYGPSSRGLLWSLRNVARVCLQLYWSPVTHPCAPWCHGPGSEYRLQFAVTEPSQPRSSRRRQEAAPAHHQVTRGGWGGAAQLAAACSDCSVTTRGKRCHCVCRLSWNGKIRNSIKYLAIKIFISSPLNIV